MHNVDNIKKRGFGLSIHNFSLFLLAFPLMAALLGYGFGVIIHNTQSKVLYAVNSQERLYAVERFLDHKEEVGYALKRLIERSEYIKSAIANSSDLAAALEAKGDALNIFSILGLEDIQFYQECSVIFKLGLDHKDCFLGDSLFLYEGNLYMSIQATFPESVTDEKNIYAKLYIDVFNDMAFSGDKPVIKFEGEVYGKNEDPNISFKPSTLLGYDIEIGISDDTDTLLYTPVALYSAIFIFLLFLTLQIVFVYLSPKIYYSHIIENKRTIKKLKNMLFQMGKRDFLTGLNNREVFYAFLSKAIHEYSGYVFYLNIKNYDSYKYEPTLADFTVKCITRSILYALRKGDFVSRVYASEFAFVITDINGDTAKVIKDRVIKNIKKDCSSTIDIDFIKIEKDLTIDLVINRLRHMVGADNQGLDI